jgi:Domain of unknown function (DUF5655)
MTKPENALTSASPMARQLYHSLITALHPLGLFDEEVKKTSVHLVRGSAFAGVHPRREFLIVTIKSAKQIDSERILKSEQVSKNRWHCEVKISDHADMDEQLIAWLKVAYDLCK